MKLIDALNLVRHPLAEDAPELKIFLACGFTPLHLQTFLAAEMRLRFPEKRVSIRTGLFGDISEVSRDWARMQSIRLP